MTRFGRNCFIVAIILLLQACSGNSFYLRKNLDLPKTSKQIQITNLSYDNELVKAFELALEEAGGQLLKEAETQIKISNVREGKRVVSYTSERKAREYLVFLKFDYEVSFDGKEKTYKKRINLDRSFIYDANFALGKAEEEKEIQQDLRQDAARLMILRLQYTEKK